MPFIKNIKIIFFIALTIFLGWYSKQAVNNPWKMRSMFYFDDNAIIFFQQNHNTRTNDYRISIPLDATMRIIDNFFIYGWEIRNREWGIVARANNTMIVIPFEGVEDFGQTKMTSDILIVSGDSTGVAQKRRVFRPKITIWYAKEGSEFSARNVHIPIKNEFFHLKRNRDGFAVEQSGI